MTDAGSSPRPPVLTGVDGVRVRGGATAEELAAVTAVLAALGARAAGRHGSRPGLADDGYERWRRGRIAAVRHGRAPGA